MTEETRKDALSRGTLLDSGTNLERMSAFMEEHKEELDELDKYVSNHVADGDPKNDPESDSKSEEAK